MSPEFFLFVVCDKVHYDPSQPLRIDIRGVYRKLRSTSDPPFPCWCASLTAFALLYYNGESEVQLRILEVSANRVLAGTPPRRVRFVASPTEAIPFRWKMNSIRFPQPGEYRIELLFGGAVAARWANFVAA